MKFVKFSIEQSELKDFLSKYHSRISRNRINQTPKRKSQFTQCKLFSPFDANYFERFFVNIENKIELQA